jgi:hypothetical protein
VHDAAGSRLRIVDAKTEAGIREVQISPDLAEELVAHIDRLRRARRAIDPDAFLFPNTRGGRMNRQRVAEIVRDRPSSPPTGSSSEDFRRCPTRALTASGGPTYRLRFWQTTSTSYG